MVHEFTAVYPDKVSLACKQCMKGQELVLFVTGQCNKNCFYCPVSEEKKKSDQLFANERPLKNEKDFKSLLAEVREQNARGMGVTGGEPLLKTKRVCRIIKFLKKKMGSKFYVHLYTWGSFASRQKISELEKAGLDEIRFHLFKDPDYSRILPVLDSKLKVGVEVPCIPGQKKELKELIDFISSTKGRISFLNLNEFEFSDSNFQELKKRGFKQVNPDSYAVKGSKKLALQLLKYAGKKKVNAHFCSIREKTITQLCSRLKRRAENIRKPFEKVNEGGLIEKATVEGKNLRKHLKEILKEFGEKVHFNRKKKRIESSEKTAKKIAAKYSLQAFKLTEYPIYDPWDFEKEQLKT